MCYQGVGQLLRGSFATLTRQTPSSVINFAPLKTWSPLFEQTPRWVMQSRPGPKEGGGFRAYSMIPYSEHTLSPDVIPFCFFPTFSPKPCAAESPHDPLVLNDGVISSF